MPINLLPRPSTRALLRAVFWDKWVGILMLLWGVYGFLDWLDGKSANWFSPSIKSVWDAIYKLPPLRWYTWVIIGLAIVTFVSLHGAYRYASSFNQRYEDITKYKIVFEVDEGKSNLTFKENEPITLKLVLRFENTDIHRWSMKKLDFTLHEIVGKNTREFFTMYSLAYSSNGVLIPNEQIEGMTLAGGQLTQYYEAHVFLSVVDEDFKGFGNTKGFLVVRAHMDASNQPMYTTDYYLSVDERAKTANVMSFSQSSALAFRQRIRRIG